MARPKYAPPVRAVVLSLLLSLIPGLGPERASAFTPFDTMTEATHRQIRWEDFKGGAKQLSRWHDGWAAHIVTQVRLSHFALEVVEESPGIWIVRAPQAEAYAVMDKTLSGAASIAKDSRVLAHEQLHFDLAESWAMRLSFTLRGLEGRGTSEDLARLDLKSKVDRIHRSYFQELETVQGQYDDESVHGTRKKLQKLWAKKITAWFGEARAALEAPAI